MGNQCDHWCLSPLRVILPTITFTNHIDDYQNYCARALPKNPPKRLPSPLLLAATKSADKARGQSRHRRCRKKDIQKLQRAIVDGLEDVKAQDIVVFDTEHLSSLFERVIVASGTSNRQTKALAMSVLDAVREAGFPKPRVEGEANGEWIIVDCGQAVVHVMQPTYRTVLQPGRILGRKAGAPEVWRRQTRGDG